MCESWAYHPHPARYYNILMIGSRMPVRYLFTATILLSAFLLFLIQPMLSKLILPKLGGSPAVWKTAMMFYQALLLGGYVYAHTSTRLLGTRLQSKVHTGLLIASLIMLPISLRVTEMFEPTGEPVAFLLASLFLSIAIPFFVLAANAPLIQHWYASHSATQERDPYVLYSASNLGSFAALLAYPFLIEPLLSIPGQTNTWSVLYALFSALLIGCVYQLNRHFTQEVPVEGESEESLENAATPTGFQKLHWVVLAFVPSSLMLGLTTYVTTDIAAAPLLWIVPLALYLLTFVLAFHTRMHLYKFFLTTQTVIITALLLLRVSHIDTTMPFQLIHFLTFFTIAIVCHGQLSLQRPKNQHLTGFYVWISVGGALGGVFNALIAPEIFSMPIEYFLVIVLSCFLRPQTAEFPREWLERILDMVIPLALLGILILQYYLPDILFHFFPEAMESLVTVFAHTFNQMAPGRYILTMLILLATCVAIPKLCDHRPVRLGLVVTIIFMALPYTNAGKGQEVLYQERNFFGVSRVKRSEDGEFHFYTHGTTLHGMQSQREETKLRLTSYYDHLRELFNSLPAALHERPVAVAGLGAGTLACLGVVGQQFDFYEIDVAVQHIAENPELFTYLRDCPTESRVIIRDARLGLQEAEDGMYGVIIMDAYSSDSLPVHLMTREALQIYMDKLAPGGILAFHISNRYLKLNDILANLADDAGLVAIERRSRARNRIDVSAHWVAMARDTDDFGETQLGEEGWRIMEPNGNRPWSDHYSNIVEALRF